MQEQSIKLNIQDFVFNRNIAGLQELENSLIMDKMERDGEFSKFLNNQRIYDMEQDNNGEYNASIWNEYKQKLSEYQIVCSLIKLCAYYRKSLYVR